jgi:predicted anti-sigma-YlaC factor YlaD
VPYAESNDNELNCASFKSRLNAVLDARRQPQLDLPLRAHARHCPQCAHWLSTQMPLLEALPTTPVEPSPDFALRVLQAVEVERRQQSRWRVRATAFAAVAATLLIAIIGWREPAGLQGLDNRPTEEPQPRLTTQVLEQVDRVTGNFKPVTTSVYTAFNAFWLANRLL